MLVDEILSYELSQKIGVKLKLDIIKNIRTTHQKIIPFFSMQIMFYQSKSYLTNILAHTLNYEIFCKISLEFKDKKQI